MESRCITVRIRLPVEAAQPSNVPYRALIPAPARPFKSLVIEARRQHACEVAKAAGHVETNRRPAVLTPRRETLIERNLGRAQVDFPVCSVADREESARLFNAGAQDAARTMQFEASSHQSYAVGEQGGGERVTRETCISTTVEVE